MIDLNGTNLDNVTDFLVRVKTGYIYRVKCWSHAVIIYRGRPKNN